MSDDIKTTRPSGGNGKGHPKYGGRAKGTANRSTLEARLAIATFVDDNAHRLTEWLDAVAAGTHTGKPDPAKAFELFQSVIEYHVPKLARTEVTGKDGGPVVIAASALDERL